MFISANNYKTASLTDWQDAFWQIFGTKALAMGLEGMWSRAVEDASKVGEGIRKNDPRESLVPLAHVFQWVLNFVSKLQHDADLANHLRLGEYHLESGEAGLEGAEDVLWYKYPGICTHCGQEVCGCPGLRYSVDPDELKRAAKEHRADRRVFPTLTDWDDMLSDIFTLAHESQSLPDMGFHFLEEVGEVTRAVRRLEAVGRVSEHQYVSEARVRQANLVEEIADVMSWSFSVAHRFGGRHAAGQVFVDLALKSELPLELAATPAQEDLDALRGRRSTGERDVNPSFSMADVLWASYRMHPNRVEQLELPVQGLACPRCNRPVCDDETCDSALE